MRRIAIALVRLLAIAALLALFALALRAQPSPAGAVVATEAGVRLPQGPPGGLPRYTAHGFDSRDGGEALERALLEHLTLGSGAPVLHCRRAFGGCEARVRRMAALFVRAGRDHGVDPWLLAAIALRESGGNNTRLNLRPASAAQNQANRRANSRRAHSRFKGVTRHAGGRWQAAICRRYLGLFEHEEDAARAYDRAARRLFGDFARLNFGDAS